MKPTLSLARRLLKLFHPEGIPWPGTLLYSTISASDIFQRQYERVAQAFVSYGATGTVLEVGTGPGWLLVKLRQQAPGLRIIGVDISPAQWPRRARTWLRLRRGRWPLARAPRR